MHDGIDVLVRGRGLVDHRLVLAAFHPCGRCHVVVDRESTPSLGTRHGATRAVGSDKETQSDFQLIAGTNRDLREAVRAGRFRDDLLARINHWTFRLPALRDRPEDIEPNIDYELDRHTQASSTTVRFNVEARRSYLRFATSSEAIWSGNFRELSTSITRMATLADGGRITEQLADAEIARLRASWVEPVNDVLGRLLPDSELQKLDVFDRLQLESVVEICRRSRSLADAGRNLFGASRERRTTLNDSDRLRKYLARFELDWASVSGRNG
jgi:transcriptional regulatory protein RtcR